MQKKVLLKIQELENKILALEGLDSNCLATTQQVEGEEAPSRKCKDGYFSSPLDVIKLNGTEVSLAEMSQKDISQMFKAAFKNSEILDKVKHNFDKEQIERITNPGKFKPKNATRGDGTGKRGGDRNKRGWGRMLQPPRPKRKKFEKKEYVPELNKLEGQYMMTTLVLGGPLEINQTKYERLDQNMSI